MRRQGEFGRDLLGVIADRTDEHRAQPEGFRRDDGVLRSECGVDEPTIVDSR